MPDFSPTNDEQTQNHKDEDYVVVEMEDENGTYNIINGEPKYITTGQVAKRLGELDSTIRFWCNEFDQFLNIEKSGRNRMFKNEDIKKLEYIKYLLKEEDFSVRQVKEYLSTKDAEFMKPVGKKQDQLIIEAISQVVISQMDAKLSAIENRLMEAIKTEGVSNRENQLKLKTDITESVNSVAEQIVNGVGETLNKKMADSEVAITQRDDKIIKMIEDFRTKPAVEPEKPRGFLSKLFGK